MSLLTIAQVVVAVILIILVLLQEKSSGASGLFGGIEGGGFYQTRRGLEKLIFVSTIILTGVFAVISLLNLIY